MPGGSLRLLAMTALSWSTARRQHVDPTAEATQFAGGAAGESDQSRLARCVGGLTESAATAVDAADHHRRATAGGAQMGRDRLKEVEAGAQVDPQHGVPCPFVQFPEHAVAGDARGVYQVGWGSELGGNGLGGLVHLFSDTDVDNLAHAQPFARLLIPAGDPGAVRHQPKGHGPADAGSSASDDDHLCVVAHVPSLDTIGGGK